ncbi:MAG TPA: APA family fibronectin-binding glycoprotein, partial [Rhodopila sp.]|nr:APA family fibronectin-binding glycoprotein [Rhodopila sp.]
PKTLALAALSGATVVALTLPTVAYADPVPSPAPAPPPPTGNTFMQGQPAAPGAPAPAVDPNAPAPPPADPNAPPPPAPPPPEPGRVNNAAGGFSYVVPAGWKASDATQLSYGQALLNKIPPEPTQPGAPPPPPPNDTSILLGRLDLKLFAGAEADNTKAAQRLASDMGEFFMPFPGTRINQETVPLNAAGMPGVASYYEVKFTDTTKPNGQIWAGVVGTAIPAGTPRGQKTPERWFVVWLGTANNPIPKGEAVTLAQSIRPWSPPPPPPPDPNAPPPPAGGTNAPGQSPNVGVPVPVDPNSVPPAMQVPSA